MIFVYKHYSVLVLIELYMVLFKYINLKNYARNDNDGFILLFH